MKLDVFTLFPEGSTGSTAQRHVQNALAYGSELRLFNYRDTTPLTAGQVDDAPYGGGAGMVLRVDVVDAALKAAYGGPRRPRVVLLAAGRPQLDDALAGELAGEPPWRSSAAATRASTSGSTSTSRPTRSRSAATCSPAASWRRWSSPTR